MRVVVVVHALDANRGAASLAEILNKLLWVPRARYAIKASDEKRHRLLRSHEVYQLLVAAARARLSFKNGRLTKRAVRQLLHVDSLDHAVAAQRTSTRRKDQWYSEAIKSIR